MSEPFFGPYILSDVLYEPWTHQFLDAIRWRCHQIMAERIRRDPSLLRIPRQNIERWLALDAYDEGEKRSVLEWAPLLEETQLDELIKRMTDPGEEGQRMRQSSPFVGVLHPGERDEIRDRMIEQWEHREKVPVA